ncbi:MAG: hypothetical protein ACQEP5_08940 [Actinomycetota bacterium]
MNDKNDIWIELKPAVWAAVLIICVVAFFPAALVLLILFLVGKIKLKD